METATLNSTTRPVLNDDWDAFITTEPKNQPESRQTLFCETCQRSYLATIGKAGWNRCKHCQTIHDAASLLTREQFAEWINRKMTGRKAQRAKEQAQTARRSAPQAREHGHEAVAAAVVPAVAKTIAANQYPLTTAAESEAAWDKFAALGEQP